MNKNILLVNTITEKLELSNVDIIICREDNNIKLDPINIVLYTANNDNNSILHVIDQLMQLINVEDGLTLEILSGDYIISMYLAMIVQLFDGVISYRNIVIPQFPIAFDVEEFKLYVSKLENTISKDLYRTLPGYIRSIYYVNDNIFTLSKLGHILKEKCHG